MKLYKVNDKLRGICARCREIRSATLTERDVPLRSGKGIVHDVLVGVCDVCDMVILVPPQSTPRIQETVIVDADRISRADHVNDAKARTPTGF